MMGVGVTKHQRRRLAMMGRQTADQARQFYEFHLDQRVPADHLLRRKSATAKLHNEAGPGRSAHLRRVTAQDIAREAGVTERTVRHQVKD